MAIDIITDNPKKIDKLECVDQVLHNLQLYQRETGKEAVVLLTQNLQLGAVYTITTREQAENKIRMPRKNSTSEFGIEIFPYYYFQDLRTRLLNQKQSMNYQH